MKHRIEGNKGTGRLMLYAIIGIAAASSLIPAQAAYTPPSTNRVAINFNLDWKYRQGDASGASAKTFDDAAWTTVCIPHSTKWVTPEDKIAYLGMSWYRKHFTLDNAYQGRKVFVEFEAAMQYAEVWVNGVSKGAHMGGYAPFTFDISGDVSFGTTDNVIAVMVNSNADQRWAPGEANTIDFQYFGGLYRDVNLYVTDKLHVTDAVFADKAGGGGIFVTYPNVTTGSATISIKTNVINENTASKSCTVVSDIVDAQGTIAVTGTAAATIAAGADNTFSQSMSLSNPKLWHPNTPNLYTLHTTVKDGSATVDYYTTRIGIRSIKWTHGSGITLNGQNCKVHGANMHQDIFGLGNAVPKRSIYYDVKRFKEAGLNFVRASHYPHNTIFYDACDEFGILVENSMTGWQRFYNTDAFKNNTYKEIKDMIRRDRNHPCVAIWETQLNESSYTTAWATGANNLAKQEFAGAQMFTCGTAADGNWGSPSTVSSVVWDVMIGASQHNVRGATISQPVIICEYGSWDYGGESSTSDVTRQSADAPLLVQCDNIQESVNNNRALSWFCADAYWVYDDYAGYVTAGYPASRLNSCGVVDYYRIPKHSYYFFQSQRDPNVIMPGVNTGPMVYIANRWTAGSPSTVRVFSNCAQVSLYRDNTLVATKSPDNGTTTTSLLHPPFTFSLGSYSAGTLRAAGIIGGVEKAWDTVKTPGSAAAVRLRPESSEPLEAGGSDARLVWIDVIDASGTVVYGSSAQVSLSITGGNIVGPAAVTMKTGQLATWVKSGNTPGTISLTAQSTGLTPVTLALNADPTSVPPSLVPLRNAGTIKSDIAVALFMGKKALLPVGSGQKAMPMSMYDLSGRQIQKTLSRNRIKTPQGKPAGIYIVKVGN
jgi:hypothetical protein